MPEVQSGLAQLGAEGWEVTEPAEGGKFGAWDVATIDAQGGIVGPNGVVLTGAELAAAKSIVGVYSAAPALINAANAGEINGKTLFLAAGSTLTINDSAWSALTAGFVLQVGQSGSATLAFSGAAAKENQTGTSASNVTLAACGTYGVTQSPSGSPKFRLSGGAAL